MLGAYVVFDIGLNFIYCVLFIKPIRNVIRNIQGSSRKVEDKSPISKKWLQLQLKLVYYQLYHLYQHFLQPY